MRFTVNKRNNETWGISVRQPQIHSRYLLACLLQGVEMNMRRWKGVFYLCLCQLN
jgi:hypothetical protein